MRIVEFSNTHLLFFYRSSHRRLEGFLIHWLIMSRPTWEEMPERAFMGLLKFSALSCIRIHKGNMLEVGNLEMRTS